MLSDPAPGEAVGGLATSRAAALSRMFAPPAVTLVGATPSSHVTEVLLANFTRPDCPFAGEIHLVNPRRSEVFGRPTVPSLRDIPGDAGLVYLLLSPQACLDVLGQAAEDGAGQKMSGVVTYAAGFAESGNEAAQQALAERTQTLGVPLLGPQSTGLISASASLLGITDPVPETFVRGHVGLIMQSTGLLGGALSWLFRQGIGIERAVGYGNGATLGYAELARSFAEVPEISVVCAYVDAIGDIGGIVELGQAGARAGKPIVLLCGARAPRARQAAQSHSGALATSDRIVRGVAAQAGVLLVESFEELLWATELVTRPDIKALNRVQVGIFTASGGGGIIAAQAVEQAGVALSDLSEQTCEALGLAPGQSSNPFDIGAISLDSPQDAEKKLAVFAADPSVTVVVRPETLGSPSQRLTRHRRLLGMFMDGVIAAGKLPVINYPFREDPRDYGEVVEWPAAIVAGGTAELGAKLRLLQSYADRPRQAEDVRRDLSSAGATDAVLADAATTERITLWLDVAVPRSREVSSSAEVDELLAQMGWQATTLVAKTSARLPHRAVAGGVLLGLSGREAVALAVDLLRGRFGAAVTLLEQIGHDAAYFVGIKAAGAARLLLFGVGAASDDADVAIRLCPLSAEDVDRLMAYARRQDGRPPPDALGQILYRASRLHEQEPAVQALDVNPMVVGPDGAMVAVDVKAYVAGAVQAQGRENDGPVGQ